MTANFHLLAHNVVSIASAIVMLGIAFFTFLNGIRKITNIMFSLMILAGTTFVISHVIGVNILDPNLSRLVLMFNLSMFFIGSFYFHTVLAMIGLDKENRWLIIFMHASAVAFIVLFSLSPDLFFLPSVPKMYFSNYYNPGSLNLARVAFLYIIIVPYALYLVYIAYRNSPQGSLTRNQYKYFIVASIIGFGIAFIPNLLVYNIKIDPLLGMPFALLFGIPFAYGAIRYEMLNIRVIAKQALLYSAAVGAVGGLITLLNYSNNWIKTIYPVFPDWTMALISAILTVTIGVIIWQRLRESDLLKYEFITTVTHKFRTPLTHIKWSSDNLLKSNLVGPEREQLEHIKTANLKLIELTNLLVKLPGVESDVYNYHIRSGDISNIIQEIADSLAGQAKAKNISVTKNINPELTASFDSNRIKFVIQVLIENAIHYTPNNSKVTVAAYRDGKDIVCSVEDSGIGISRENMPLLFSKFYRGDKARMADTEGVGIGLSVAKEIISRHRGKIWAKSTGLNKGSTFYFSLPSLYRQ
ncbi:MAG: hypothetical protein A3D52_01120 [Candidatus Taylorbacteria bacterium RIFCSPHIGHO2_02_FULL_44_36]|uniref:histidine kinase n=1 Tax=Candidatus Taylorbacteria bacterium RIFCSPLOWO2_12_FULL_44_15c TaxID=1802333 RepID=A0A1G2P6K8_9BACT|nr:MAG: hypothetical protein A3D52_01120 [Candidatus Taylorbacteria bacterium RIFCSPHIGHO2_02_FULL_44_36]OHA37905.1 MAG: hypothetical protein A3I97_00515 [Candidatus Taylorbacteria bacterium RIFCSPLOWO2_02_FULL_44_35]OHA43967.1 MAG: hypothetical protein A3G03_03450 [Candidatus Taylorbacteria bacterium RIFCSPLOWO2_12_FULL_44_15c]